ncbi:tRNA (adenine(37)-N6)-methyltransferase [Microplitis demolitor]|uniref:tRNA (adenine(37)-N6)-methyltransferase n=1 Tax=Microplitis demolitor TaxID=69319 RepID=UPI0004CD2558|nr:tRNA (adenine(37)-N6)-methyltransferase [Microplitis demolitor]
MDTDVSSELDPQYLLGQLNTARSEINNLRQQVKGLKYIFEKDVSNIKRLIGRQGAVAEIDPAVEASTSTSPSILQSTSSLALEPIGIINTGFPSKRGTPRQPGIGKESRGKITLFNTVFTNPEHALNGLEDYSHMWILFHFHRNDSTHVRAKVAPPRLNGARTGVFSTRSPHRPCPIGLSLVKIINIEGNTILFEGVDTVDGTPVLDIKPYIPQYDDPLHVEQQMRRESVQEFDDRVDLYNDTANGDIECFGEAQLDVSRDEELAMRLQAEEFQGIGNDLNLSQRPLDPLADGNLEASNGPVDDPVPGPSRLGSENPQATGPDPSALPESEDARNSRLLDGADGPSIVCVTDMDLINRRALNPRLDNSPIRMGVREAPDGEEGFESQPLRPSLTVGNIQSIPAAGTFQNFPTARSSADTPDNQFQVRVPDWISQPLSQSLSVVFNERAVRQLTEIAKDKSEEQKRAILNVLREDPRSVYLRQRWANQFYTFLINDLHISCRFDDTRHIVTVFQVRHAGRTCECGEPEWQCLGHSPIS